MTWWQCFLHNKIAKSPTAAIQSAIIEAPLHLSTNSELGVLPPGKITNDELFQ